ncbi:protein BRANCHLESS TRICHOME-like [Olea europaea var. sylvestris]|uniref:BRANCHLESS TRICHOME n=1 Tax=Olea europaea subsp. europaea TaxID=158383 RepID=A0A8S0UYF8_OLEEU|nr:protein BRANCHLESS TRICHOME-like [Olea europaea var. sylvestris]CAA3025932.1 BRANCHLESS TRICHOME [Olea europaea subsp. europaea]
MTMVMMVRSQENSQDQMVPTAPITTSICPTWKLYENPFYISHQQENHQQNLTHEQIHHLHLPISARKIAASFWDLTFIKPLMESELEVARGQIVQLKAELECERKVRKNMESLNKKLARELSEERKGREALERVCQDLAKEVSFDKGEFDRMKKEMEEERKMLHVSEVLREERVQMKLSEAKLLLEEKLLELEDNRRIQIESSSFKKDEKNQENDIDHYRTTSSSTVNNRGFKTLDKIRFVLADKPSYNNTDNNGKLQSMVIQRRASPEPENPHIKRGIKGFVEFPKVIRAIGCRSKHMGTKLECQKAQLNLLLKQKGPVRLNGLIAS